MFRFFESEQHADVYKKFRLRTPQFVIQKVINFLEEELPRPHGLAVDVGCGSGQNTQCWAPYFESVAGYDTSAAQIEAARRESHLPGNVTFGVAPAEALPVADSKAEMVVGSTSIHWFDFPVFFHEVDRILVPGGAIVAITHKTFRAVHPTKADQLNQRMDDFTASHIEKQTHPRADYVVNGYRDLPLPYEPKVYYTDMPLELQKTVAFVAGTYTTWSPFQKLYRENPDKMEAALRQLQEDLLAILEVTTTAEETPLTLRYDYCVAMCRKPVA